MTTREKYCLDANVLIEAWNKYYSPKFFSSYWDYLNQFGKQGRIFIPQAVFDEIAKSDDELLKWLKASSIVAQPITETVTKCLKDIFDADPVHIQLVDNIKQRSLADPWVVAHAIHEKACVVTKETKNTTTNSSRIRIPNVCDNMKVRWINDFQFIEEMNLHFSCVVKTS